MQNQNLKKEFLSMQMEINNYNSNQLKSQHH